MGSLAGGEWAGTSALITFTSARARPVNFPVGARWKAAGAGRGEYGPIIVQWSGADTIKVQVVALLRNTPETPGTQPTALSAWFATKSLTLRAGETATVDLEPGKVPVVRRRFPRIVKQSETHPYHDIFAYSENYEVPGIGHVFFVDSGGKHSESPAHFPKDLTTWDREVADLSAFGLRLCGEAEEYDPWLHTSTRLCDFALDERPDHDAARATILLGAGAGREGDGGDEVRVVGGTEGGVSRWPRSFATRRRQLQFQNRDRQDQSQKSLSSPHKRPCHGRTSRGWAYRWTRSASATRPASR